MKFRRFLLTLTLPIVLVACGAGDGAPGGPVEPPPPIDSANIVANGNISFGLCTGPAAGCYYTQEYTNTGTGCANSVHGRIRAYADETVLESDDWWLDTTVVFRPGEQLAVEDCCFSQDTVRRRTRTVSETFWNNIACN